MTQQIRPIKGQKNYLQYQKRRETVITVIYFAIVLAVFLAGLLTTGTRMNAMTVAAVVGVLPATKQAIKLFMILRKKACDESRYEKICHTQGQVPGFFELLMTSQKGAYVLDAIHVTENEIIALAHREGYDAEDFTSFLKEILKNNNFSHVKVKLYEKEQNYLERLKTLSNTEVKEAKVEDILRLLLLISI